ncbi:rhodanese-like domain-containing protein [Priestia taiwanensis]|uniref:Rhodanese-like domain-containing protein n=1 Tax=Priestia taiwanensis TaxID=1347902 RepID=A0A917ATE0_9BACI|nr:rhodanese-like domain-containing protein [Priestia taiwanensis]MBM7363824.1 rhodanese-related sulfurtransferase [Priestia taiwanensis]GGE73834.1 rhodanese-like domain-containing protein [Priestia taiwanensis]
MTSWMILIIVVVAIIAYSAIMYFYQRKLVKPMSQEEFINGYRKAQLIDLRESEEYKAGHILGARNIPMSQLKMRITEIRADQPVYLYCHQGARCGRAGQLLKKKGITNLYQLQGGFKQWTGKIKKK